MKTTASSVAERYFAFMQSIQGRQRGFLSIGKLCAKNNLSMALGTILNKEKLIERNENGIYKWSGPKPTMEMAIRIAESVNDSIRKYDSANKSVKYNPIRVKMAGHSSDILDLSKLRKEKVQLLSRVQKIDAVLEVAMEIQ